MGAYELQGPRVIYVDDSAVGANNGSSWADAYNYLQDALMMASSGDEIRVGRGIYKPGEFVLSKRPNLGRMETFQLKNGVALNGGYAGFGAPDPDARHAWTYDTILSGDINGDDASVSDPCDMGTEPTRAENSLHVVTSSGTDHTAVLDGFHITGGQADGTFPHNHGGGIHNFGGSPTVNWCNMKWNYSSGGGGGMSSDGEPNFINCYFYQCSTGGSGGGLYVWSGSATLIGCTFITNSAGWGGGGLAIQTATATVTYTDFRHNSGGINGGGMCCDGGTYTLTDCIFWGNSAERGGALWNIDCTTGTRDNPVVSDCRFYNNEATKGGGMFNTASTPKVVDCTFHKNSAESFGGGVYNEDGSAATFEDCSFNKNRADVRGGGMSNHGSSPELTKCTFTSNYAGDGGGGINISSGSSPKLLDCLFEENTILDGGGGGMYNFGNPALTDCTFIGNTAPYESGGGINSYGSLTLESCVFITNSGARGGGIHCTEGSATLSSCLLIANSGSNWAGGFCSNSSTVTLTNCTFTANSSPSGNALGCRSAQNRPSSNVDITNCILWDSGDEIWNEDSSTITITYSDVQDGWEGEGNIDTDPCFASLGYWGVDEVWVDGDYHLLPGSACINTGDPGYSAGPNETDLDGNRRVSGGRIDMGVYELQPLRIVYVDADATGNNDGSSWADAYNRLQDALSAAYFGDKIWVAQGVYKPDEGGGNTSGDREATFQLIDGVTIKGGYAGFGEPEPNDRDVDLYKTILSGDLAGDDGPDFANYGENSRYVVTGHDTRTAILDGLTITSGNYAGMYNRNGSPTVIDCTFTSNEGSGMYNVGSWATLTNCSFTCNWATYGGGMYNSNSGTILINCTFSENIAFADESGYGGGMYNSDSNPVLTNCIFTRNMADTLIPDHGGGEGGGMCNTNSDPVLTNCIFSENTALCSGGGMSNRSCSPTINNCVFTGNMAIGSEGRWGDGGGMNNESYSNPELNNCTFTGNSAGRKGGGIYNYYNSQSILTNCIFWGDTALQGGDEIALWTYSSGPASSITVSYSDVEGGAAGVFMSDGCILNWETGNIDVDPCFVEPGYWDANGVWVDGDFHLLMDSVCINAGDPNYVAGPDETDLDGKDRVICGRIDMGAYEFHCPKIVYVDADAAGNNDGSSWTDAYNLLQDGLAAACEGDEIWVGQGVYKPDQGGGNMDGDREATFQLKNGVAVRGGFAGFGETDPDARDNDLYETVLSGDLAGDDVGDLLDASRAENSYHVVTGSGTDVSAVLDGFTITSGNAFNTKCSSYDSGGGMYNNNGNPTVANCTFTRNTASDQCGGGGAGMYNRYSNPTVISCEFVGNEYVIADDDGGGGMNNYRSNPTLINCRFRDNKSNGSGGGMLNYNSNPILTNCIFINNSSAHEGGGMENRSSSPELSYCTFISNSAYREGGGMRNESWSSPILIGCEFTDNSVTSSHSHGGGICNNYQDSPTLINCLFTGNSAHRGGGMYSYWGTASVTNSSFSGNSASERGGAMYYRNVSSTLTNCIVWGNTALQGDEIYFEFYQNPATMTVSYSDIRGGEAGIYMEAGNILNWGEGNIDAEPLFADSDNGDYRLSISSPCIDAGDNDSVPPDVCDLDGNTRIVDGDDDGEPVVDMGAYELGLPPIEVEMKLVPQSLNPNSKGKWVKANFVLPEGYAIEDVDTSRPAEFEQFQLMSESMEVFVNKEDLVEVIAAFDRSAFCGIGPFEGEIAVAGYLTSGRRFRGTDTIRMANNKLKHLGILATNWLSVCSAPDWCNGADLDQDSVVNFVDFALLDGCCFEVIKD
jgi:hypothetical protein